MNERKEISWEQRREPILSGRYGGGTTWIVCTDTEAEVDLEIPGIWKMGISVGDIPIQCHLTTFLYQYFDPNIQWAGHRYVLRGLRVPDPYGDNLYTVESIRLMLKDIRNLIYLLRTSPDDPSLEYIVEQWPVYGRKRGQSLTSEEAKQYRWRGLPVVLDFYERFCDIMEKMIQETNKKFVLFQGP